MSVLKTAGRSVAMLSLIVSPIMVGCDTDSNAADREIRQKIAEGQRALDAGGADAQTKAEKAFSDAAGNNASSPANKAFAKAMLANFKMREGADKMLKISRLELEISKLQSTIAQLATQVGNSNTLIQGYSKYNPADLKTAIQAKIVEAQGGPDKPAWFTHDSSVIPTLAAANQEVTRLEGQLSEKQEHIRQQTDKRTGLLNDAEKIETESQSAKGQASVDQFKKASDLRKQAADIQTDIDQTQAAIVPIQVSLDIAKGQQQAVDAAIKHLQAQSDMLDKGWKDIQTQSDAQAQLAKAILASSAQPSSDPKLAVAISDKAAAMDNLVKEITPLREGATSDFNNAATLFGEANNAAQLLWKDMQDKLGADENKGRAELTAWKNLQRVMDPQMYKLQQAAAERQRGSVLTSTAAAADARLKLSQMLTDAAAPTGVSLPQVLQAGTLAQERKDALAGANEAFKNALLLLESVTQGNTPKEVVGAAYVDRVLAYYAWAQADRLTGDRQAAEDHMKLAEDEREKAIQNNATVPPLPMERSRPTAPTNTAQTRPSA